MKKRIRPEDPEFTELALGEASPEAAANWEIAPEDQSAFDELKAFSTELEDELASSSSTDELGAEREAVLRSALDGRKRYKVTRFPVWISSMAACLTIGLVSLYVLHDDRPEIFRPRPVPIIVAPLERTDDPELAENDLKRDQLEVEMDSTAVPNQAVQPSAGAILEITQQNGPLTIPVKRVKDLESVVAATDASSLGANHDFTAAQPDLPRPIPKSVRASPLDLVDGAAGKQTKSERDFGSQGIIESTVPPKMKLSSLALSLEPASPPSESVQSQDLFLRTPEKKADIPEMEETIVALENIKRAKLPSFNVGAGSNQQSRASGAAAESQTPSSFVGIGNALSFKGKSPKGGVMDSVAGGIRPSPPLRAEISNREGYALIEENGYKSARDVPLSTFSVDADTASYANTRRFIEGGRLPVPDAVRIEELVNYFRYDYQKPEKGALFSTHVSAASAPWSPERRLVRIALQGEVPEVEERPDANLVFLIDVSGSMNRPRKLPLVKESLNLLVSQLEARDRIAVVVYAGASGLALPSTTANNQETISHALDKLRAGGSTNGGAGIELAYKIAEKHFVKKGINRVILCTDGDFNVGVSNRGSLTRLIQKKAKSGVFFTALGFGMGNLQDDMLETLSNKGNGFYGYIDSRAEARKLFVEEMIGSLQTIAKDVKIQVEFNPSQVAAYRLIGYENRALNKEDFNNDKKDAGEIGAGHSVTAFYEVIPVGVEMDTPAVDPLKYQTNPDIQRRANASEEMLTVKLRYKEPDGDASSLIETPFVDNGKAFEDADADFRFGASVVAFGMLLRNSEHLGNASFDWVIQTAGKTLASDPGGHRGAFLDLVGQAKNLAARLSLLGNE